MNMILQRTIHTTISRYKLNLPFSERRLLLFLGDATIGLLATGAAVWLNSLFS